MAGNRVIACLVAGLVALLAVPAAAAGSAAAVTEVTAEGAEIGETHVLECTAFSCRGSLPIRIASRPCTLNVTLDLPPPGGWVVHGTLTAEACVPALRAGRYAVPVDIFVDGRLARSRVVSVPNAGSATAWLRAEYLADLIRQAYATHVRIDFARLPDAPQR